MRWYACQLGFADEMDFWGMVGLLHDIDFELYPEEHCIKAPELLREGGVGEEMIHAIYSHGWQQCKFGAPNRMRQISLVECHSHSLSFHVTTFVIGSVSGDGKPEVATTIDHETLASRYVQTRERSTVGIVARGVDGFTRAVHLGREHHVAQIATTDGNAGDRSRSSNCAA